MTIDPFILDLPTKEETTLRIRHQGQIIEIDLFDLDVLRSSVKKQVEALGQTSSDAFVEVYLKTLELKYGLKLGKTGMMALWAKILEKEEALKKKSSPNSNSVDFSEQNQSSETQTESDQ